MPKEVQEALLYNKISERHARSLLSLNNKEKQIQLLNKIINEKLTVKQTEEEISDILNNKTNFNFETNDLTTTNNKSDKSVQEFLNIDVPEVISIGQEIENDIPENSHNQIEMKNIESNSLSINPFQENFMDKIKEINEISSQEISPDMESKIEKLELETKPNLIENNDTSIFNSSSNNVQIQMKEHDESDNFASNKQLSLPKVIEKIRNLITELNYDNNVISTSEVDLSDQYQIVINIKKE